jgi:TRAP transporter TAXI family solute receptor
MGFIARAAAAAFSGLLVLGGQAALAQTKPAVRIGTSSMGSTFYIEAVGLSKLLTEHAGMNANVQPLGGSEATLFGLVHGRVELAVANAGAAYSAYHGVKPFKKANKVTLLAQGEESFRYILVRKGAGIKSLGDLKGKTIIGRRPSLPDLQEITDALVEATDLNKGDLKVVSTVTSNETDNELRAGTVGAALMPGGLEMPIVVKLFHDGVVDFLYLPMDTVKKMEAELPKYFFTATVPAGHFEGQSKAEPVLGLRTFLVASPKMSADAAYQVTKTLFENHKEFASFHVSGKQWTLKNTLADPKIPFNPGAIRYFKEKGLWTPALEKTQEALLKQQ